MLFLYYLCITNVIKVINMYKKMEQKSDLSAEKLRDLRGRLSSLTLTRRNNVIAQWANSIGCEIFSTAQKMYTRRCNLWQLEKLEEVLDELKEPAEGSAT